MTKILEYRLATMQSVYRGKHLATATIQKEIVTLRMTLKAAVRHGWLDDMPDMSAPYQSSKKVSHRARFSPDEYKQRYAGMRAIVKAMTSGKHRRLAEQLHDKALALSKETALRLNIWFRSFVR